jgi:site-specific DNA-methyltransferase (adenine-specific)
MERLANKYSGCIDMILCDLPYGTTRNKWDSVIDLDKLWSLYKKLIKPNGAIVLTAQTPFDKVLGASNLEMLRYEWIWEKDNASNFLNARRNPMKIHENVLVFYKKMPKYNPIMREGFKPYATKGRSNKLSSHYMKNFTPSDTGSKDGKRFPVSILKFNTERGLHPTQKPVALFEYLIKTYTNEGDIVLDNCMGSGTTAVACLNTNRNFIGFELDENYFKLAKERIGQS